MADFDIPPEPVLRAIEVEDDYRTEAEDQWAAHLDAIEAARTVRPLNGLCVYCGREACHCRRDWEADARLNNDEWWD